MSTTEAAVRAERLELKGRFEQTQQIEEKLSAELQALFDEDIFLQANRLLTALKATPTFHCAGDEKSKREHAQQIESKCNVEALRTLFQSMLATGDLGVDVKDLLKENGKFGTILVACAMIGGMGDLGHYISYRKVIRNEKMTQLFNIEGVVTGLASEKEAIIQSLKENDLLTTTEVITCPKLDGDDFESRKGMVSAFESRVKAKKEFREKLQSVFCVENISTPNMREILHPFFLKMLGSAIPIFNKGEHGGCPSPSFENEILDDFFEKVNSNMNRNGYKSNFLNSIFQRNMGAPDHGHFLSRSPMEERTDKTRAKHLASIQDMKFMNRLMGLKGERELKVNDEKRCSEFLKTRHIVPCFCRDSYYSFSALMYAIVLSPLNKASSYEEIIFVVNPNNFNPGCLVQEFLDSHKIQVTFINQKGVMTQSKTRNPRFRVKIIEYKLDSTEDYQHLKKVTTHCQIASGDNSFDEGIDSQILTLYQNPLYKTEFAHKLRLYLKRIGKNALHDLMEEVRDFQGGTFTAKAADNKMTPITFTLRGAEILSSSINATTKREFQEFSELQRTKNNFSASVPLMLLQEIYYRFLTLIYRKNPSDPRIEVLKQNIISLEMVINEHYIIEFNQELNDIDNSETGIVDLTVRNFTPTEWRIVFERLKNAKIRELIVSLNTDSLRRVFPEFIEFVAKNDNLNTLDLSASYFTPKEYGQLFLGLHKEKNKTLKTVHLAQCGLNEEVLSVIATLLEKGVINIKALTLQSNNLDSKSMPALQKMMNSKQLGFLDITSNSLNLAERLNLLKLYLETDPLDLLLINTAGIGVAHGQDVFEYGQRTIKSDKKMNKALERERGEERSRRLKEKEKGLTGKVKGLVEKEKQQAPHLPALHIPLLQAVPQQEPACHSTSAPLLQAFATKIASEKPSTNSNYLQILKALSGLDQDEWIGGAKKGLDTGIRG